MRRHVAVFFAAASLLLSSGAAIAEGEHEAAPAAEHHAAAQEHHGAEHHGEPVCTAVAGEHADEQCAEYWEHNINWWSFDYRKGKDQALEHRHMSAPFGFALINFAFFAYVLYRIMGKPIGAILRERHTTIKRDLEEAAALRKAAELSIKEAEERASRVDADVDALLREIRAEAEAEKKRIIAAAEVEAERLRRDAETRITAEIERARRELRTEVVDAALGTAEKMLREKINPDDQRRLVDQYVTDLERVRS